MMTGFGGEEPFVRMPLVQFDARIADAVDFALTRRVLLRVARQGKVSASTPVAIQS